MAWSRTHRRGIWLLIAALLALGVLLFVMRPQGEKLQHLDADQSAVLNAVLPLYRPALFGEADKTLFCLQRQSLSEEIAGHQLDLALDHFSRGEGADGAPQTVGMAGYVRARIEEGDLASMGQGEAGTPQWRVQSLSPSGSCESDVEWTAPLIEGDKAVVLLRHGTGRRLEAGACYELIAVLRRDVQAGRWSVERSREEDCQPAS